MTKYWMTNAMRMAMTANTMRRRKAHCSSVRLRRARPDSAGALLDPELEREEAEPPAPVAGSARG